MDEKKQAKTEVIADIAAALVREGIVDKEQFKNTVEALSTTAAVIDKSLERYELIRTDTIELALLAIQNAQKTAENEKSHDDKAIKKGDPTMIAQAEKSVS